MAHFSRPKSKNMQNWSKKSDCRSIDRDARYSIAGAAVSATELFDRQEDRRREALNDLHDRTVVLVGNDLRQHVEAGDDFAELAFETQVAHGGGAFVGKQQQFAASVAGVGEFPHCDFHVACGIVKTLRLEVVEYEKFSLVMESRLNHAAEPRHKGEHAVAPEILAQRELDSLRSARAL